MGKRIISQAIGKGSLTYRVRKQAYIYKVGYPKETGQARIVSLIKSPAHSAPLIKILVNNKPFYNVAFRNALQGQMLNMGNGEIKDGNILAIKDIPAGTKVFNIEKSPFDGGKMVRVAGSSATINKIYENGQVGVLMSNKQELLLDPNCRATIGVVAGEGKNKKPFLKAGNMHYKMKSRNKLWPRTSAIKVNAIDHPFGSGRGKRAKPKIAKRNAPPGRRVGHLRPKQTGKRK